jgi:peptide/nickel transport system permease protein
MGQKAAKRFWRGFKNTWKLYRNSKSGVAGLAIVFGFVFVAVFAPWIAPYDKDFKAPSLDTFIADYVTRNLTDDLHWTTVLGLTAAKKDHPLERVMVYSQEGQTWVFDVNFGISEETGQIGIEVGDRTVVTLPANASYINFAHFAKSLIFVVTAAPEGGGAVLYEYSYAFDLKQEYAIPFVPKYHSNLWNGYSFVVQDARLALAFADDHNVWIMNKRPPMVFEIGVDDVTFTSTLHLPNTTIIGNPLVIDGDFTGENANMVFIPTDVGILGYELEITRVPITRRITDISIGNLTWRANYTIGERSFEPVAGNNMITFTYPFGPVDQIGKEFVAVASTDGDAVAFDRVTGNVTWANRLIMTGIRDFEVVSLHPSPNNIVLVGSSGERGIVAAIDPKTGLIGNNHTMFSLLDGQVNSRPFFVRGEYRYVLSTERGTIYLITDLMRINATFSVPGGGAAIPVTYAGNIYIEDSKAGNYFAVVTEDSTLFMETLTGVNIAPLPPGTYPSGNRYILGTDYEGHDILTLLMFGTQAELMVGISAAFFSVVIGTIVGLVAGFYPGFIDDILMRATDVMLSLPYLVIMLLFAAAFGPSLLNIIIIFAILSWASIARVIRSVTMSIKQRSFVDAAVISGASNSRLIFRHIGPNVLPYAFLYMTFMISGAIITEAILAFLGFGDPSNITWGMMLQFLQISGHTLTAPWWLLPPGMAITLLSLAFYLIGRAFDEVVNPRLRRR